MAFTSMDDFINAVSNLGQFYRTDWCKLALPTTAQVAGSWYDLYPGTGNPAADGYTTTSYGNGASGTFVQLVAGSGTVGIPSGPSVSPLIKSVINASVYSSDVTTTPAIFMLVDILGFYPITNTTFTTLQTLSSGAGYPVRYNTTTAATTGVGLRCYVVCSPGSATTAMGAGTPNISMTYTNSNGVSGRTTPLTLPVGNTTAPKGQIVYSGIAAAGKYGPFMPLAAGDSGIASVQSFQLSTTYTSGTLNLVICRPILTIPITTAGVAGERDMINQIPSLPRIYDGSVLSWLMFAGAATPVNSSYYGHLDFAWN